VRRPCLQMLTGPRLPRHVVSRALLRLQQMTHCRHMATAIWNLREHPMQLAQGDEPRAHHLGLRIAPNVRWLTDAFLAVHRYRLGAPDLSVTRRVWLP
jgi:hypothetical protein